MSEHARLCSCLVFNALCHVQPKRRTLHVCVENPQSVATAAVALVLKRSCKVAGKCARPSIVQSIALISAFPYEQQMGIYQSETGHIEINLCLLVKLNQGCTPPVLSPCSVLFYDLAM